MSSKPSRVDHWHSRVLPTIARPQHVESIYKSAKFRTLAKAVSYITQDLSTK